MCQENPMPEKRCHLAAISKVKNKKYTTHLGKIGRRIENREIPIVEL